MDTRIKAARKGKATQESNKKVKAMRKELAKRFAIPFHRIPKRWCKQYIRGDIGAKEMHERARKLKRKIQGE